MRLPARVPIKLEEVPAHREAMQTKFKGNMNQVEKGDEKNRLAMGLGNSCEVNEIHIRPCLDPHAVLLTPNTCYYNSPTNPALSTAATLCLAQVL